MGVNCRMDYRDDGAEGQQRGMEVGLGGCGSGGNMALDEEVVCEEASGKNAGYVTRRKIYKLFAGTKMIEVSSRLLKCPDQ